MKTAIVDAIGIFTHCDFPGITCPLCKGETVLLSTTNEWKYWCKNCDKRFNKDGVEYTS